MELFMRLFRNGFTIKRSPVRTIPHTGYWRAAAHLVDISPDLEVGLAGFSIISNPKATGFRGRLYAAVTVIDDGVGHRVALIGADLHSGTRYLTERVASLLPPDCGIRVDAIIMAASHTHYGPGNIYGDEMYDRSMSPDSPFLKPNLDIGYADMVAGSISEAIVDCCGRLEKAEVTYHRSVLTGWSVNRSMGAFSNEVAPDVQSVRRWHEQVLTPKERTGLPGGLRAERYAVDPRMHVIRVRRTGGEVVSVHAWFGAHGSSLNPLDGLISSDSFGDAVRLTQTYFHEQGEPRQVPVSLSMGVAGDVNMLPPQMDPGLFAANIEEDHLGRWPRQIGQALSIALLQALQAPGVLLSNSGAIALRYVEHEMTERYCRENKLDHKALSGRLSVLGSEFGRYFLSRMKAKNTWVLIAKSVARAADRELNEGDRDLSCVVSANDVNCPRKVNDPSVARIVTGKPPSRIPMRMLDLGPLRILAVPFECTVSMGRAMERALGHAGPLVVSTVTGSYTSYVTTEREYLRQHYEGASTLWGRHTGAWCTRAVEQLARSTPWPQKIASTAYFSTDRKHRSLGRSPLLPTAVPMVQAVLRDHELSIEWRALPRTRPAVGPDPWFRLVVQRPDRSWAECSWCQVAVTERLGDALVKRTPHGLLGARWAVVWRLPPSVVASLPRDGSLGLRVVPSAFGVRSPVRVRIRS
jgi:neutral ceramidase